MDHLPRPSDGTTDLLEVPFVVRAEHEYNATDIGDFKSFPARHGFNLEREQVGTNLDSFVQSWLYFGLLAEFCQKPIDLSAFLIRETSSNAEIKELVSSRLGLRRLDLPLYPLEDRKYIIPDNNEIFNDDSDDEGDRSSTGYNAQRLRERRSEKTTEEDKKKSPRNDPEYKRQEELIKYAQSRCNVLDKLSGRPSDSPLPTILLSVRVLLETLWTTCMGQPSLTPLGSQVSRSAMTVTAIRYRMLTHSWCPFQIECVLSNFPPSLVCYISQIRRRYLRGITHEACSEEACMAFNIDPHTYESRHTRDGCPCRLVSSPISEIRSILWDKQVPLVFLRPGSGGRLSLGVKAAKPKHQYVAFSHVWSDGLGNVSSNAIPECQLDRLARYTSRYGTKYFWLDTLCIPLHRDGDDWRFLEMKKMAIHSISFIFASAYRVVVLDSEIRDTIRLTDLSNRTEIMARALFSSWSGRCWTLEEGALSRNCRLQCRDGEYNPRAMPDDHGGWKRIKKDFGIKKGKGSSRDNNDIETPLERGRSFEGRITRMVNVPLERDLKNMFPTKWENPFTELMTGRFEESDLRRLAGFGYDMEHFRSCWNTLARRQTSRPSDRVLILANLLDLNISMITGSSLPMMALLKSVDGVPLELFYDHEAGFDEEGPGEPLLEHAAETNTTDESTSTSESYKRWLPPYPGAYQLHSSDNMRWGNDVLALNRSASTELFLISDATDPTDPSTARGRMIDFVGCQGDATGVSQQLYKYHVDLIRRRRHRPLPKDKHTAMVLLIDRNDLRRGRSFSSAFKVRGALFRGRETRLEVESEEKRAGGLQEQEEEKKHGTEEQKGKEDHEGLEGSDEQKAPDQSLPQRQVFTVQYDCPVRVLITPLQFDPEDRVARRYTVVPRWRLELRHDCPEDTAPVPRRYGYGTVLVLSYIPRFLLQLLLRVCSSSSMILFVVISFRAFSKRYNKSPVLKGLVVLYWLSFWGILGGVRRDFRQIIAAIAYAACKIHLDGRLSELDESFVSLEVLSHGGLMLARELHRRYFKQRVIGEWLRSLRRENVDRREMKWTRAVMKMLLLAIKFSFTVRGRKVPDMWKEDPLKMLLVRVPLIASQIANGLGSTIEHVGT